MVTISSAESALKNIYLETVINDINTKTNPFLTMIQKNAKTANGKEARADIRYGNEGCVTAGAEGGDLPMNTNGKVAEIRSPLKNLYGTFQISDKALRAAQNNPGAFASLLNGEMENLISNAQSNLNSMLYGNGKKYLGYTTSPNTVSKELYPPARFYANFNVGDSVEVYNANNELVGSVVVDQILADRIKYTGTLPTVNQERLYIYSANDDGTSLNGIDSIFRQDNIYNLAKSGYGEIAPCIVKDTTTSSLPKILNEEELLNFFDAYEEQCQGNPADILLTHPNVRKAIFEDLKDLRTNVDSASLAGGFKGFSFNGIPVYSDIKCKAGTLYALNSGSWALHELCDWTWLNGDDGNVLRQIDGKAGYSATLVKYADLLCDKPFIQGKVTNYSANRYKA